MELLALDLHFLGNSDRQQKVDLCVHGGVYFQIDGDVLSDGDEWCVSASAYRFLLSATQNHISGAEEFLIPCCGHSMYATDEGVEIIGCNNGIDFDIVHDGENVTVKSKERCYTVPLAEYKKAVLSYAKQIHDFYLSSPARIITDDFEKAGFDAFKKECDRLYGKLTGE